MVEHGRTRGRQGLDAQGIRHVNEIWWNLSTPALYEHAVQRHEGHIAHLGPFVVRTGQYTGRSPKDRYIVREPTSDGAIWWGKVNLPFDEANFKSLHARLRAYYQGKDLYVQDCYVGADPDFRIPIRVVCETAWHSMFARNMFVKETDPEKLAAHVPQFTVIHAPGFSASPDEDGTNSEAFILLHFGRKEVIIGGTGYAGEIKKSMFTVMNYLLPPKGVLSMHCSANYGADENDVALFFGLSGTGKTTLSADPHRTLIGDDEHGWSDAGVFNFEGGCYAKVIRLSPEGEPEIYATTRRFGTILENVAIDPETRRVDLDSDAFTGGGRHSIFQRFNIIKVHEVSFLIPGFPVFDLLLKPFFLFIGIIQFGKSIGDLTAGDEKFKPVRQIGSLSISARERGYLHRITGNKCGLDQMGLYQCIKKFCNNLSQSPGLGNVNPFIGRKCQQVLFILVFKQLGVNSSYPFQRRCQGHSLPLFPQFYRMALIGD